MPCFVDWKFPSCFLHFFLIKFFSKKKRNDVLRRGPWTFKKDWLALLPLDPTRSLDEILFPLCLSRFVSIVFWLLADYIGRALRSCVGTVVGTNTRLNDDNIVDFLRV
ncbi:hypothetical protein V6N13_004902 [Hibiscus sabdariffa]